jgi:diguanylate cyclase (GGDEF)-like protein/PAS domain S-box-containing protein
MNSEFAIADVMQRGAVFCDAETSIRAALQQMLTTGRGSVLVLKDRQAIGIWTERDALALEPGAVDVLDQPITQVMSSPVQTVTATTSVGEVGKLFKDRGIRHFVVTGENDEPLGIVSQTDVVLSYGIERFLYLRSVRSVLGKQFLAVTEEQPYIDTLVAMREQQFDAAVVLNASGAALGILTERDAVRLLALGKVITNVGSVASKPVFTVEIDETLWQARSLAINSHVRHLVVVDEAKAIVGLLSFDHILGILEHEYVTRLERALNERDDALAESKRNLQLAHRVIEASLDGVLITDSQGVIEMVNPAFSRLTGYRREEVLGKTPAVLKSGRHDAAFYHQMWQGLQQFGRWQGEIWNRRKCGEIYPEWLTITAIQSDGGERKYAAVFNDISERKKSEERIRTLAYYDMLTELPNRRLFFDRVDVALRQANRNGRQVALLYIDLDRFKQINDTYGHIVGDGVLVEIGKRLMRAVRDGDTVARLGGDEFAAVLPDQYDDKDARALAQRMIASVKPAVKLDGESFKLSVSIGVALFPQHGANADLLMREADKAMYRAKEQGRDRFQISEVQAVLPRN